MSVRLVLATLLCATLASGVVSAQTSFDATYDPVAGNEWWVEVYVDANEPLAGVEARADGGAWHDLSKRSWGAWAASFHVPDGSIVEFRATSTDGDTHTSQGYVWPEATPADEETDDGGDTGTEPTTFDASYDPVPGNEWWVEVYVDANEPLSNVAARADGGTWHDLSKRSWGAWAGSFHVPDGSIVEFRATSTDGDTHTSQGYIWPEATPTGQDPGDGDTPDTIDAAFGARAGNEWWVETYVVLNGTISKVEARADGGPWHELTKRSWGTWAGSFHAPQGSIVEFRVTDANGETDLSDGFRWTEADAVGRSGDWPYEGSYMRTETWYDPPGGYHEDGYALHIYHDGVWWTFDHGQAGYEQDTQPYERFSTSQCPGYGPTSNVAPGDDVDITHRCTEYQYNATVRHQTTHTTHVDGREVQAEIWYASDRDPCNCLERQVGWDRDIGLVTFHNLAGRGAQGSELIDTDAPLG